MSETTYSKNYSDENAIAVKSPIADALDRLTAVLQNGGSESGGKDNIDVTFVNLTNNVASIIVVGATTTESDEIAGGYLHPRIVSVVSGDMSPGIARFSVCNESTISIVDDGSGQSFAEDSYQLMAAIPDKLTQYEAFENVIVIYSYGGGGGR